MSGSPELACPDRLSALAGQVAIITGGSSGIGKEVCLALAAVGVAVAVVGRDRQRVAETVEEVRSANVDQRDGKPGVLGLHFDVRSEVEMERMVACTLEIFGRVDILIASAGILRPSGTRPVMLAGTSTATWDQVLGVNLQGIFLSNRAVLKPMMRQRGGQIINVGSLSGRRALPLDAPYCASKFGVVGLGAALAAEVAPWGIRVHTILPGNTETPIWAQNDLLPRAVHRIAPRTVANFILHLLQMEDDVRLEETAIGPLQDRHQAVLQRGRRRKQES